LCFSSVFVSENDHAGRRAIALFRAVQGKEIPRFVFKGRREAARAPQWQSGRQMPAA
jgi:hypothetical protein